MSKTEIHREIAAIASFLVQARIQGLQVPHGMRERKAELERMCGA